MGALIWGYMLVTIGLLSSPLSASAFVGACELKSEFGLGVNARSVVRLPRKPNEDSTFLVGWADAIDEETAVADRPVVGADVEIMRCLSEGSWVSVGRGQVFRVRNGFVEAKIKSVRGEWDGELSLTEMRERSVEGNFYLRPMVGDRIVPRTVEVFQKLSLTPIEKIPLEKLFKDQEISEEGKSLLVSLRSKFKNGNGRLLIEVESSALGDRNGIRFSAQMKANLIAQTLVAQWNLNADQIVAFGRGADGNRFGSTVLPKWPMRHSEENVILKMIPTGD